EVRAEDSRRPGRLQGARRGQHSGAAGEVPRREETAARRGAAPDPPAGRRRLRRGRRHHHGHPRPAAPERERVGPRPPRRRGVPRWRITTAVVLGALLGAPLAAAFAPLFAGPLPRPDAARLLALCRNTALLVAGTLALCLPPGVVAAVLLYRTDLPGRRFL